MTPYGMQYSFCWFGSVIPTVFPHNLCDSSLLASRNGKKEEEPGCCKHCSAIAKADVCYHTVFTAPLKHGTTGHPTKTSNSIPLNPSTQSIHFVVVKGEMHRLGRNKDSRANSSHYQRNIQKNIEKWISIRNILL